MTATCTDEPIHLLCAGFGKGACLVEPDLPDLLMDGTSGPCAQCSATTVQRTPEGIYLHDRCRDLYVVPRVESGTKPKGAFARLQAKKGLL
jgi:hypothetical protein